MGGGFSQVVKDLRNHVKEFGLGEPLEFRTRHDKICASEGSFWNL